MRKPEFAVFRFEQLCSSLKATHSGCSDEAEFVNHAHLCPTPRVERWTLDSVDTYWRGRGLFSWRRWSLFMRRIQRSMQSYALIGWLGIWLIMMWLRRRVQGIAQACCWWGCGKPTYTEDTRRGNYFRIFLNSANLHCHLLKEAVLRCSAVFEIKSRSHF